MDTLTPNDVFHAWKTQVTSSYDHWVIGRNVLPCIMGMRDANGRYLMELNRDAGVLMLLGMAFKVSDDEPEALYVEGKQWPN